VRAAQKLCSGRSVRAEGPGRRWVAYGGFPAISVRAPALAVATVGTWGLTVWVYQAINGPPGPPKAAS